MVSILDRCPTKWDYQGIHRNTEAAVSWLFHPSPYVWARELKDGSLECAVVSSKVRLLSTLLQFHSQTLKLS